ncbi:MAG: hypothetical protein ACFHU9_12080 [Fluviicola sp.]
MLNTILNSYLDILREEIIRTVVSDSNEIDVKFVKPYAKGSELYMNALNIALFSTIAEKDLLGKYNFGTPTTGNNALNEKPPLRMTLDTLLIFNFRKYETALDCYGQVLGYFYNNDCFTVKSDGYDNEVQVLLSSFSDLNEIEIWNSFNTPGIMMLRYELKYAIIKGKFEQLPVVRKFSTTAGQPAAADISTLIMNMVYLPVAEILNQNILTATNNYCSINLKEEDADQLITDRYNALLDSYTQSEEAILAFTVQLQESIDDGSLDYDTFNPFIPSLDGLLELIPVYRSNLEAFTPDMQNYKETCTLAKEQIDAPTGLNSTFLGKLSETTAYLQITDAISSGIEAFDVVGGSAYEVSGEYPDLDFTEQPDLSVLQIRQKWWEIEDKLGELIKIYSNELDNPLLDEEGAAYDNFVAILEVCQEQLIEPYEAFSDLNQEYNVGNVTTISETVRLMYLEAYEQSYYAVNYTENQEVTEVLAAALQDILIEQNLLT